MRVKVVKGNDVVKVFDFEKESTEPVATYVDVEPPVTDNQYSKESNYIKEILTWDGIHRYNFPSGEVYDVVYQGTERIVNSIMIRLGDNTKWTDVEVYFAISAYDSYWTLKDIAKALNKSVGTINKLFKKFRDVFPARRIDTNHHKWSDEDKAFLKEHYNDMTYNELAKALGQTSGAVVTYVSKHRKELNLSYKDRK